jgi:hypothetical protein
MTPKEHKKFASGLRKMDIVTVREHADPSFQPEAQKRAMAATELERRRQEKAPEAIRDPIAPRLIFTGGILVAGLVAAYWGFF